MIELLGETLLFLRTHRHEARVGDARVIEDMSHICRAHDVGLMRCWRYALSRSQQVLRDHLNVFSTPADIRMRKGEIRLAMVFTVRDGGVLLRECQGRVGRPRDVPVRTG